MISKIVILALAVVAVCAQEHGHGHEQHGHGHAVSSQSVLHQVHPPHSEHHDQYEALQHDAPAHHEPVSVHHAESVHHAVQHDSVHHAAPTYQVASDHNATPAHHEKHHNEEEQHDYEYARPNYEFEYTVEDPHTGDRKSQHEFRDGDVVKGVHSQHEADGSARTVKNDSDKHTRFNAYVKHSEPMKHIQPERHAHK